MAEPQEHAVQVIANGPVAKKRKKKNHSSTYLAKMKTIRAREYRANETKEHREARLAHMRLMAKHRRLSETKEEREHRLQMMRNNQKSRTKARQRWLKEVARLEQEMSKNSKNHSIIDESLKTAVNNLFDKRGYKSSTSLNKISRTNDNPSYNNTPKSRVKRKSKLENALLTNRTSCILENNNRPNINNNDTKRITDTDSDDELFRGFDKFSIERAHSRLISVNNILSAYMTDQKLAKNYTDKYENYVSKYGFHKTKDSSSCTNSNVKSSSVCRPPRKKIVKTNKPKKATSNVKDIKSQNKCSHNPSTDKIQNNASTKPNIVNLEQVSTNIEVNVRLAVSVEKIPGKLLNKISSEQNSGFQNCTKDRNNALKPDENQCTINSVLNKRKRIQYNENGKTSPINVLASSKTDSQKSLPTSNNLDSGCESSGKVDRYSSELEQSLKQKIRRQKAEFYKSNKQTSGKVLLLKNKSRNRWIVLEPVMKSEEIVIPTIKQPTICLKPLELLLEPVKY